MSHSFPALSSEKQAGDSKAVGGCSCEISRPGQTRGAPLWQSFVNLEQENAAETVHMHFSSSHTHTHVSDHWSERGGRKSGGL